MAIAVTLATLAVPKYFAARDRSLMTVAVEDLRKLEEAVAFYQIAEGKLPESLDVLEGVPTIDPWGGPYRYQSFSEVDWQSECRRDKFLAPINSWFDLYSTGPDGLTERRLSRKESQDDIIRANDGVFVGEASAY